MLPCYVVDPLTVLGSVRETEGLRMSSVALLGLVSKHPLPKPLIHCLTVPLIPPEKMLTYQHDDC